MEHTRTQHPALKSIDCRFCEAQNIDAKEKEEDDGMTHPAVVIVEYFAPPIYRWLLCIYTCNGHFFGNVRPLPSHHRPLYAYIMSTANIQHHQFKRKIHFFDSIKRTSLVRMMMVPYLPWKVQIEKLSFSTFSLSLSLSFCCCSLPWSFLSLSQLSACETFFGLSDIMLYLSTMSMPIVNVFDHATNESNSIFFFFCLLLLCFHHSIVCKCLKGSRFETPKMG